MADESRDYAEESRRGYRLRIEELKRYRGLMLSIFITAAAIIVFFFAIYRFKGLTDFFDKFTTVTRPFIIGFIMAYLMNPIMMFLEKKLLPPFARRSKHIKKTNRRVRMVTTLIALAVLLGIMALFFSMVMPRLASTANELVDNLNEKIIGVLDWANDVTHGDYEEALMNAKNEENIEEAVAAATKWVRSYLSVGEEDDIAATVARWGFSAGRLIFNFVLGCVIAVYVLMSKDQFKGQIKKLIYGFFPTEAGNAIVGFIRNSNKIFYGFVIGKLIDSLIIGCICYICMLIMRMPYAVLTSVIIGLTNFVPVFGPYIGAVPTVIIIFVTEPIKGIYFLIFVIILQQIDGNIIGPKILGDSTGIPSFWVVLGIVAGGGFFGLPGMLLGVPTMAVIYNLFRELSRNRLRQKDLPEKTRDYILVSDIDPKTHELHYHD